MAKAIRAMRKLNMSDYANPRVFFPDHGTVVTQATVKDKK
jgi:hypothetical protein